MIRLIRSLGAVVLLLAGRAGVCRAQGEAAQNPNDSASRFSRMMPLAQYLITDRATEIAVAKSAAPAAISDHADVWILGRHGYEIAVRGTNGFACMVERAWTSDFDEPDFMNPTAREPTCFNAAAARTILPRIVVKTRLAFAGVPKEQMVDSIRAAYARHELPLPARGAMSYMMSKETYFGPYYGHGGPHLMFYFPRTDSLAWGAGVPNSPVIVHQDFPEPVTTFVIPLAKWADGTPAGSSATPNAIRSIGRARPAR